eukprot:gene8821-6352_t
MDEKRLWGESFDKFSLLRQQQPTQAVVANDALAVTFEQVQILLQQQLQPVIDGQAALATTQAALATMQAALATTIEEIRTGLTVAEVRRIRKELNCWLTNCRTQQESTEFKHSVIAFFGRAVTFIGDRMVTARCMVSDAVAPYEDLRPPHLVKHSRSRLMLLYGLDPQEIDNPRNGILMLDSIATAFDHLDVCFLYNALTQELTLKVLRPELMTKRILPNSALELRTFADIDGSILRHRAGHLPYRRVLSVHAKFAFSRALSHRWIENTEHLAKYFNVSEAGLEEPQCIRDLTWEEMNYADIVNTV